MLGKSAMPFCHRGPLVGGLPIRARRVRRRARAIEKRSWRRDPLNRLYNTSV